MRAVFAERRKTGALDLEALEQATQHSPGVRRMTALVGSETSFERGRALLDELAGVDLTAKAVEREAEAIGADIAAREQAEIARAIQLDLPETGGPAIPILYIEMDGTGVPVAAAETAGRKGRDGGAAWIWNLAHEYFPGAVEIVDLYHARQHLWELAGEAVSQPGQAPSRLGLAARTTDRSGSY